jgi:hypothetical protein
MGFGWEKKNLIEKIDLWKLLVIYRKHQVDFKWIKGTIIIRRMNVVMNWLLWPQCKSTSIDAFMKGIE